MGSQRVGNDWMTFTSLWTWSSNPLLLREDLSLPLWSFLIVRQHHDSISGLERSAGERTSYLLQYSWASLVAQLVKNPPAMQKTWVAWVQPLGWEDALRRERLPTPVFWPEEYHGIAKSWTWLSDFHFITGKLEYYSTMEVRKNKSGIQEIL